MNSIATFLFLVDILVPVHSHTKILNDNNVGQQSLLHRERPKKEVPSPDFSLLN